MDETREDDYVPVADGEEQPGPGPLFVLPRKYVHSLHVMSVAHF